MTTSTAYPEIQVTMDYLRAARDNVAMSGRCPVALSIAYAIPESRYISVDRDSIKFTDRRSGERMTWDTPPNVQKLIDAFDNGNPVRPLRFNLGDPVSVKPVQARPPTKLISAPVRRPAERDPVPFKRTIVVARANNKTKGK